MGHWSKLVYVDCRCPSYCGRVSSSAMLFNINVTSVCSSKDCAHLTRVVRVSDRCCNEWCASSWLSSPQRRHPSEQHDCRVRDEKLHW